MPTKREAAPLGCPFCGVLPTLVIGPDSVGFRCDNGQCPVSIVTLTHCETGPEAIRRWNTRKPTRSAK